MTPMPLLLVLLSATPPAPGAQCPRVIREALAGRAPCVSTARQSCLTQEMATEVATRFATPREIGQNARIHRVKYSCTSNVCTWKLDYESTAAQPVIGSGFSIVVNDTTCKAWLIPGL